MFLFLTMLMDFHQFSVVADRLTYNNVLLKCDNDEVFANVGQNVSVTCTVTFGEGTILDTDFHMFVRKVMLLPRKSYVINIT